TRSPPPAHGGWRVEILLSRRVYRSPGRVRLELAWCHRAQITCRLSPPRFRFDHAKYFLVDGRTAWIGTLNMTYDGFTRNREAALVTSAPSVVRATRAVFRADWHDRPAGPATRRALVLSPHSGFVFRHLLAPHGPVAIETEEFYPPHRLQNEMEHLGRQLRLILPARAVYDRAEQ
ncbi:phospholipase D family protein, partial [mine drainage metagenome]